MNNLYHKLAVASVGMALGLALGANKEAKAATLTFAASPTFFIDDTITPNSGTDGLGDRLYTDNTSFYGFSFSVSTDRNYGEKRSFHEFSIDNLSLLKSAIFTIYRDGYENEYPSLQIFGYVGNGRADLSDYQAGESLGIIQHSYPARIDVDVTQFVNERISNHDAFVGFSLRIPWSSYSRLPNIVTISNTYAPPRLTIETVDVPEPVPEPTTIFGSALALTLGGWLKRKKSSQQQKTTSQH